MLIKQSINQSSLRALHPIYACMRVAVIKKNYSSIIWAAL